MSLKEFMMASVELYWQTPLNWDYASSVFVETDSENLVDDMEGDTDELKMLVDLVVAYHSEMPEENRELLLRFL